MSGVCAKAVAAEVAWEGSASASFSNVKRMSCGRIPRTKMLCPTSNKHPTINSSRSCRFLIVLPTEPSEKSRLYKTVIALSCVGFAGLVAFVIWFFTHVVRVVQNLDASH